MKVKKNILIITDGSGEIVHIAAKIREALSETKFCNSKVLVKSALEFKGNDILPVDVFFLGCEKPKPDSFAYLEDLMKHINLANRFCGIFSSGSEKAIKYLSSLVKDSEVSLYPATLLGLDISGAHIKKWAEKVVSGS